jgi:hypothetical protein
LLLELEGLVAAPLNEYHGYQQNGVPQFAAPQYWLTSASPPKSLTASQLSPR